MSGDKEKYTAFANAREDLRIYNKPFWLDAVCGPDNWDAIVVEENKEIVATVPYYTTKDRGGISCVTQPQLTQCFEIWTQPVSREKQEKYLACQFRWIGKIAEKLLEVGADCYQMMFSPELDNWEPFYWEGFHQQTRYSFVIEADRTAEGAWSGMNSALRRSIRHTSGKVVIEDLQDLDVFYQQLGNCFSRQGMKNPLTKDLIEKLYYACSDHNAVKMLAVREGDEICNTGYYVFDRKYVYELMLGSDPLKRNRNYKSLMTYQMIRFAGETGRGFDFEGSMKRSIAEHNRRFGAVMIPYYHIWKVNAKNRVRRTALEWKYRRQ